MGIVWTEHMRYRARLRGFDLDKVERIMRHSTERYYGFATQRPVVVGRHDKALVLVPYEREGGEDNSSDYPCHHAAADKLQIEDWEVLK